MWTRFTRNSSQTGSKALNTGASGGKLCKRLSGGGVSALPACLRRAIEHHLDVLAGIAPPQRVEAQPNSARAEVGQDQRAEFVAEHIDHGMGVASRADGSDCLAMTSAALAHTGRLGNRR